jgi:glutathionyl-hydroquinone reductase
MMHFTKEKFLSNATLPHIYQSTKEKKTCGEYSLVIRKLNIAMQRIIPTEQTDFYFEP